MVRFNIFKIIDNFCVYLNIINMLVVFWLFECMVKVGKRKFGLYYNYDIYNFMVCFLLYFRFIEDECDEMFIYVNVDDDGNFNYNEFIKIIKYGEKDD